MTDARLPAVARVVLGAVSAVNRPACDARAGRPVWWWGRNSGGQLGDGTEIERNLPVVAIGLGKLRGDANCDGTVTSIDAALILQFTAGLLAGLSCNADANANGSVDAIDAALVLQFTAGLLQSL